MLDRISARPMHRHAHPQSVRKRDAFMHAWLREKGKFVAEWALRAFLFLLVIALLAFSVMRKRSGLGPDYCPIDGVHADWSRPRNSTQCDYGHFNYAEKVGHTWSAPCT
jgi:hypothetical protein